MKAIILRIKVRLLRLVVSLILFVISQLIVLNVFPSFRLVSIKSDVNFTVLIVPILWIGLLNWPVMKLCNEYEDKFLMKVTKVSTAIALLTLITVLIFYGFILNDLLLNEFKDYKVSSANGFILWSIGFLAMFAILKDYDNQRKEFVLSKKTITFGSVNEMLSYFRVPRE